MARTEGSRSTAVLRIRAIALSLSALVIHASVQAQVQLPSDPTRPRAPLPGTTGTTGTPATTGNIGPSGTAGEGSGVGLRAPMTVTTGILTAVTFSDNGNLAPKGSEEDSVQLQLTPYISVDLAGPRAQGYLYYAPSFFAQTLEGSTNQFSNNLTAYGNYYLYEDKAGIRATANIYDTNTSPFAASSVNPGINAANLSTYQYYSVTPYARGRLGSATDFEARYRLAYTDLGGSTPTELDNRVSGIIGNVSGTSRLGWRALGTYATTSYSDGFDYDRAFVTALGYYVFSPEERIGLGFNCAYNSILLSDSGENSGCGVAAAGTWRPSPRTSVEGYFANAYYGYTGVARATHVAQGWLFGLNYRQGVVNQSESTTFFLNPTTAFSDDGTTVTSNTALLNALDSSQPGVVAGQRSSLSFGSVQSALVAERAIAATVGYSVGRLSYGGILYYTQQSTDNLNFADNITPAPGALTDLEQRGVNLRLSYQLDPRSSVLTGATTEFSTSDSAASSSRLSSLFVGYYYQLTRLTTGGLNYRYTVQKGEGPAAVDYVENAVIATVNIRF